MALCLYMYRPSAVEVVLCLYMYRPSAVEVVLCLYMYRPSAVVPSTYNIIRSDALSINV